MIIRKRHKFKIASLRDAWIGLIVRPQTALRLSGVIEIKPLRGFFMVNADNHINIYRYKTSVLTFAYPILDCNTATLQQTSADESSLSVCRVQAVSAQANTCNSTSPGCILRGFVAQFGAAKSARVPLSGRRKQGCSKKKTCCRHR